MAHYAEVKDGVVQRVIVAHSKAWCEEALGGDWVQTSYNTHAGQHPENRPLNKNYAGIGFGWDGVGFFPPKCHDEAVLNQETYLWDCTNEAHIIKEITNDSN